MSIGSLTSAAMVRRDVFARVEPPAREGVKLAEAVEPTPTPQTDVTKALAQIASYIPTEILTLYVAVLAAIRNPQSNSSSGQWGAFVICQLATPTAVWLVYVAKLRQAKPPLSPEQRLLPVWEMVAGTVAYVAWAVNLPDTPVLAALGAPEALAGIVVLAVATVLGLVASVVLPLPEPDEG